MNEEITFDRTGDYGDKIREMIREDKPKERWELVEEKANDLLADTDWVQDVMIKFDLFADISSACRGDDDVIWKMCRAIKNHARHMAEREI